MLIRATICLVVSSLGFGIIGCGGDSGPKMAGVSGTVTFGGKPISGATVTMQTEGVKAQVSMGFTDTLGKFKMTTGGRVGVPVGNARVAITKTGASDLPSQKDMKPDDMMKMQQAAGGMSKKTEPPKPEIPEKYADPTKSGLTATVGANESKNVFEFNLVE